MAEDAKIDLMEGGGLKPVGKSRPRMFGSWETLKLQFFLVLGVICVSAAIWAYPYGLRVRTEKPMFENNLNKMPETALADWNLSLERNTTTIENVTVPSENVTSATEAPRDVMENAGVAPPPFMIHVTATRMKRNKSRNSRMKRDTEVSLLVAVLRRKEMHFKTNYKIKKTATRKLLGLNMSVQEGEEWYQQLSTKDDEIANTSSPTDDQHVQVSLKDMRRLARSLPGTSTCTSWTQHYTLKSKMKMCLEGAKLFRKGSSKCMKFFCSVPSHGLPLHDPEPDSAMGVFPNTLLLLAILILHRISCPDSSPPILWMVLIFLCAVRLVDAGDAQREIEEEKRRRELEEFNRSIQALDTKHDVQAEKLRLLQEKLNDHGDRQDTLNQRIDELENLKEVVDDKINSAIEENPGRTTEEIFDAIWSSLKNLNSTMKEYIWNMVEMNRQNHTLSLKRELHAERDNILNMLFNTPDMVFQLASNILILVVCIIMSTGVFYLKQVAANIFVNRYLDGDNLELAPSNVQAVAQLRVDLEQLQAQLQRVKNRSDLLARENRNNATAVLHMQEKHQHLLQIVRQFHGEQVDRVFGNINLFEQPDNGRDPLGEVSDQN